MRFSVQFRPRDFTEVAGDVRGRIRPIELVVIEHEKRSDRYEQTSTRRGKNGKILHTSQSSGVSGQRERGGEERGGEGKRRKDLEREERGATFWFFRHRPTSI